MIPNLPRRALLGACAALLLGGEAGAMVVHDPANYAQNLLQAARALEQVQNQVASLQNEAAMLLNQSRNLQPLPYSAWARLQSDMGRVSGLLAEAGRIAGSVQAVRREFEQSYRASLTVTEGDRAMKAAAEARWLNSVEAFRRALTVQAAVVETMEATRAEAGALVDRSQGAAGALQAAQAGNQLLALQSKQLADLTALLAAQGQAQALEQARGAASAAEARARLQRFVGGRRTTAP